jgi:sarcosine oxidase subunit alpha
LLPAVERGRRITIYFDDKLIEAYEGETVAAALFAADCLVLRRTQRYSKPRGVYCGMGQCFECRVSIDGRPAQRACMTSVRDGMHIRTGEERT